MKTKSLILALLVFSVTGASFAPFAQAQQTGGSAPAPPSAPSSTAAPGLAGGDSGLDLMGISTYLLGPGDVVEVRVQGEPQMSGNFEVDDLGKIELPFVDEPIHAKCLTDRELREIVRNELVRYIRNPRVYVRLADRRSRPPAVVFGAVRAPSRFQMNRRVRLLELLAQTGGLSEQAGGTIQIFHTQPVLCAEREQALLPRALLAANTPVIPMPEAANNRQAATTGPTARDSNGAPAAEQPAQAETANGDEQSDRDMLRIPYDVYNVADLRGGREEANPVIRPGDIVIVQEAPPIYITGAVMSPQGVFLRDYTSLTMAIARVGGLRPDARANAIRVYRQQPGSLEPEILTVNYDDIRGGRRPDFQLQPYDIVEVREAGPFSPRNLPRLLSGMLMGGITQAAAGLPMRVIY